MKKYIISPLCSALIIPGLGQIINQNLIKGLTILSIVFLLFVGGTIKLAFIIKSLIDQTDITRFHSDNIMKMLQEEDLSSLFYLIIAFAIIWIYSILDAFWVGKKMEGQAGDEL